MTKFEKISISIAFLGFFTAALSLGVSYLSYKKSIETTEEQAEIQKELRSSKIVLQIERSSQPKIKFENFDDSYSGYSAIYTQKYNLIINNLGFQAGSIIDWRVLYRSSEISQETGEHMYGWFRGMNQKLFNKDGSEIDFPITIDPNTPQKLILEIGVRVPNFAWSAVESQLKYGELYSYYEVEEIFRKVGYPQFGQLQLDRITNGRYLSTTSYGEGVYAQHYLLYLTKGDGTEVSAKFSHNINGSFIQGQNGGTSWAEVTAEPNNRVN